MHSEEHPTSAPFWVRPDSNFGLFCNNDVYQQFRFLSHIIFAYSLTASLLDDHEPRVANHVETTVGARFNLADLPGHLSRVAQLICCTHDGQKQYGARPARVCGQEHCEKNCHEADAPHHVPRQQKTVRRFCALIPDSADELQRQK